MKLRKKLRLPREHGAWGMLYTPWVLGALVAWQEPGRLALLLLAMTFVFIGRESVLYWWRARANGRDADSAPRMAVIYLALAGACGAPLLLIGLYGLMPVGLAAGLLLLWNAGQAVKREERTVTTEVVGIAGLSLTAPAAYYVSYGSWDLTAAWLWLASVLYFVSSVFYVKLRVLTAHAKRPEPVLRARQQCMAYHAVLVVTVATLVAAGHWHPFLLTAYVPVVVRAVYHLIRPTKELVLKKVGYTELGYSLVWLGFAVAGFR
jgi:4-hydroxybenzoate polyprenyltransferase